MDLAAAMNLAADAQKVIQKMRDDADEGFHDLFTEIVQVCDQHNIDLTIPRTVSRQRHRNNVRAESLEEDYKRASYILFLDSLKTQEVKSFLSRTALWSS